MSETQKTSQTADERSYGAVEKRPKTHEEQIDEAVRLANSHGGKPRQSSQGESIDQATLNSARRLVSPGQVAGGVVLAGVVLGAAMGIEAMHGGSENGADRGEIDPTIETIVLDPDANLRFDPSVKDEEENNLVLHPGAQVMIDANHDIRVLTDTNNGTWYAIPAEHLEAAIENFDDRGDKDDLIWVNEAGVADIVHTDLPTLEDDK